MLHLAYAAFSLCCIQPMLHFAYAVFLHLAYAAFSLCCISPLALGIIWVVDLFTKVTLAEALETKN